jgi:hypothetical protein
VINVEVCPKEDIHKEVSPGNHVIIHTSVVLNPHIGQANNPKHIFYAVYTDKRAHPPHCLSITTRDPSSKLPELSSHLHLLTCAYSR